MEKFLLFFPQTINEHWWPIEARSAAIANNFYTVNLNRIGTEMFKINDGNGEKSSGRFYGSTYIAAPNGYRTKVFKVIFKIIIYFIVMIMMTFFRVYLRQRMAFCTLNWI